MRARIQGRYGRYADSHDMRTLLGLGKKPLPPEGMPVREIQGVKVYVKPLGAKPTKPTGWGRRAPKRQGHRVMVICNCGTHVPAGRLHQHKCKEPKNLVKDPERALQAILHGTESLK